MMLRNPSKRRLGRMAGAAVATAAAATGVLAGAIPAAHAAPAVTGGRTYAFMTIDNPKDPTFNQLLGINSANEIAGYYGSGAAGHPNKGYTVILKNGTPVFRAENFPGSRQTQVTALNNKGDTAGFWVNGQGTNEGFVRWNGVSVSYRDPNTPKMPGAVNQLLGINDSGVAVGFYVDAAGNMHAYKVNQATSVFRSLKVPGVSAAATGINDAGDIVGFSTTAAGKTFGWLIHHCQLVAFQYPHGSDTQPLGINKSDEIVGSYVDARGNTHGFTLTAPLGPVSHWSSIDDPNGIGSTVVNGVNNAGDLVGFYTDSAGNTDGFLAR